MYVGTYAYGQCDYHSESELEQEFRPGAHAILIVLEHLDVVIGKPDGAAPQSGDYEEYRINAVQTAYKQGGTQQCHYYYDSSHRRGAFLLHLPLQTEIPYGLSYLLELEFRYNLFAGEICYKHAQDCCQYRPERQIVEQSRSRDVRTYAF